MAEPKIRIDVWSDYVCPFCYLECPVLDRVKDELGGAVDIVWRAFELRPEPVPTLDPAGEYLRTAWARSVYPMAQERGMTLRLPPVQPRSRLAHEAAAHARGEGRFDPMHRAIFHAFFEEGRDIGQADVLVDLAESAGLESEPLRAALQEGRYTRQVLQDEDLARQLGVSGVPMTVLRRGEAPWREAVGVSGAVPYRHIRAALEDLMQGEALGR